MISPAPPSYIINSSPGGGSGDHILPRYFVEVTNCVKSISYLKASLSNKLPHPNKVIDVTF